jgi:rRNA maturation protein Nop10
MKCERCGKKISVTIGQLFRIRSETAKMRVYGDSIKCPKCGMPTKVIIS